MQAKLGNVLAALIPRARIVPAVRPEDMSTDPEVVRPKTQNFKFRCCVPLCPFLKVRPKSGLLKNGSYIENSAAR